MCLADVLGGLGGLVAEGDWAAESARLSSQAARSASVNWMKNNQLNGIQYAPVGELILPADNVYDSIGIRHNTLIKAVYQSDPDGFFTCSNEELQRRIYQQYEQLYGPIPKEVLRAAPLLQARVDQVTSEVERVFLRNADENSSDEELVNYMKTALAVTAVRMPEYEKELRIVMRYLESMIQLPDYQAIEIYTDGFRRIVEDSGLPGKTIGNIYSGISIAANSNYLWQEVNTGNGN